MQRQKGCGSIGTLSSRSSSIWNLEQAMDNALYGPGDLDLPRPTYFQENCTSALELVKKMLPNVQNLSQSDIETIASVVMKHYKTSTEGPSSAINQNILKSVQESRVREISNFNSGGNASQGGAIKESYLKQGDILFKNAFECDENIGHLQDFRLRQSYESCRLPVEQVIHNESIQTQLRIPRMIKNENLQNQQMLVQERAALSELCYGQPNAFTNAVGCSKLISLKGTGQIPVEKMNNLQISDSKSVKLQEAPSVSWLGSESYQKFSHPTLVKKRLFENDEKMNIGSIWDAGLAEGGIFPSANHVNKHLTQWSQNKSNINMSTSLFADNIGEMRGNILLRSPVKNQSSLSSLNLESFKENALPYLESSGFPRIEDDQDAESFTHYFNRAPGGPVRIGQSKTAHISSPYKRF